MSMPIAQADQVAPGKMRRFDLAGTRVNVTNVGGRLYAIDDTCTHMGCSLADGSLEGTVVTCVCHGSQFDVTSGAVLRGPALRPVRSIPLTVENGQVLAETPGADR